MAHIVKYVNWQTDEETAYREIGAAHECDEPAVEVAHELDAPFQVATCGSFLR